LIIFSAFVGAGHARDAEMIAGMARSYGTDFINRKKIRASC